MSGRLNRCQSITKDIVLVNLPKAEEKEDPGEKKERQKDKKKERFSPLRERDKVRVRGTVSNPGDQRDGGHQIWGKEVETADPNHNWGPCYSIALSQQRITLTGGKE
ncbi:hypothetical protein H112_06324 [Trichophyton rubrum D6]|uniref:Uncharacterized protein n=2 Tax=Trichophyton TaxID=5550 RepID=A0A022VW17_TRIRU|nr:hypothetical protein H100_06339 [Trichophyton rubrum MR850]EZF39706.1 hypothetical protein H102_06305 [Trichophyton rubrum CBS 100081]EZF50231.1 hypothetical protein H103_06331 [Trichophyton rubrum CBS 288.86]EZF60862.1 hypothetical protein H104_06317 [Trichophyton rubrum CBS 289.86]EZF71379.1 hypothetical protein H105_06344 [Trichophyton soudanense CBS 452.61]EZF82189.1 hypothetical protein H110_06327 [Trichophyton rubrum MR1448]EZF92940.1 hypothetical protein H113_06376 [Trichophyton rub